MARIVSWFSCGVASAVCAKLALIQHPQDEVVIARCVVANEHPDNERFHVACEEWFERPIQRLASTEFADCWEVWEDRRYISGIHGAPCTIEMKKAVRWEFERQWKPDFQAFGFTIEEEKRAGRFRAQNPEVRLITPLIDAKMTKEDCHAIITAWDIERPEMYKLGFSNNNCIGCAKATSIVYWARVRHHFPAEFARMSELSRRLGARLTRLKGKRIFLDEMPADINWQKKDRNSAECGILCVNET